MNMLTNKVPFGLLGGEEQELFLKLKAYEYEVYQSTGGWYGDFGFPVSNHTEMHSSTYRLKLKEGEWYKLNHEMTGFEYLIKYSGMEDDRILFTECYDFETGRYDDKSTTKDDWFDFDAEYSEFRPATQEEIDSVKPKETFIEVDIEWYKNGGEVKVPNGEIVQLEELRKNFPIGNCIFLGFFFEGTRAINAFPIVVDSYNDYSSFEIKQRATKARFIEVG